MVCKPWYFSHIPRFNTVLFRKFLKFLKIQRHQADKSDKLFRYSAVEQNTEKPGPSGQKFNKLPLEEQDEALELLSDED